MIKDNQQYHEELAKELAGVLGRKGGIMKDGLVGLDQAWCVWNRARGIGEYLFHFMTPVIIVRP